MLKPFLRSLSLLRPRQRLVFYLLTLARVFTNLLDVLGLMAIGLLGSMLASGLNERSEASFAGFTIPLDSSRNYFWVLLVVVAFFLTKSVLATILLRLTSLFLARTEGKAATEIAAYLYSGDFSRVRQFSRGDLHYALTASSHSAMAGLLISGAAIATEGALFLSVAIVFFLVDSSTSLVITAYFLLLVAGFQLFINRRLKRLGKRLAETSIGVTDTIQDLTLAFREITVFSKRVFFLEKFSGFRKRNALDTALQSFLFGLPRFFVETGLMVGVLTIIGWQFLRGNLSDGLVTTAVFLAGGVRMMAALLPLQNAVANIKTLGPQAEMAQDLLVKARLGKEVDSSKEAVKILEPKPASAPQGSGCAVELSEVVFTHHDATEPVIRGVSLSIPPGGHVAFVGPSGAGKTTMADLILGINSPDSGIVSVDGLDPRVLREQVPGRISYVPQAPGMVAGTVAENVALGVPREVIDEEAVIWALERAQLASFVRQLPDGIHSSFGKHSDSLSGGQRQRLGLARALYTSPGLLVLDEATSALDAGTEASIASTIARLGQSTTVIIIAHRLSTIQDADRVFVFQDGRITAEGSFPEVRKQVPLIEEYVRLMSIGGGVS